MASQNPTTKFPSRLQTSIITLVIVSIVLFIYAVKAGFFGFKQNLKSTSDQPSSVITPHTTTDSLDDIILNKIVALTEVKQANHYIDSFSNHKHGISLMIIGRPNLTQNYYTVRAGYNGEFRYETYFTFCVERHDLTIRYYNVLNDSLISIEEWRRLKSLDKSGSVF